MYPNGQPNQQPPYGYNPYEPQPQMYGMPPQPPMQGYPQNPDGSFQQFAPPGYPPQNQFYPQPGQPQMSQGPPQMYPGQPQMYQGQPAPNYQQMPMTMPYGQPQQNYGPMPVQQPFMPPMQNQPVRYDGDGDPESEPESDDEEDEYESDGEWELYRGTPTLFAADPFDPQADAAVLRKAMKGFGTDEDALISVLCRRTSEQRQEIAEAFEKAYGKTLAEKIKSETGGKFETLLVSLLIPLSEFYCRELAKPMSAKKVLVEVLCSLYNYEIDAVKNCYQTKYGQDLEAAILGDDDSNTFQDLMVALCDASKDESPEIDVDAAKEDANNLIEDGDMFANGGLLETLLRERSYDQLRTILREYQIAAGESFLKLLKRSLKGSDKTGMVYVFRCLNNKAEFFAHQLHEAMDGLGTNDQKLIRLIVTRCEIDMVEIKAAFQRIFGESLKNCIKGDCSGDYKHALYALIGEERS